VYARQVDDKTLTLFVSGYMSEESLVMQDQETKSYWSQILGEAKAGPLKGKKLEVIPAVLTDWRNWSQRHPEGTVVMLSRITEGFRRELLSSRLGLVLGIVVNNKATAWRFDILAKTPMRNELLGDKPVLVVFDEKSFTARIYERELDGRALRFHLVDNQLTDRETRSTWDAVAGLAVAGPLKGKRLPPLPAMVSSASAWKTFHPNSTVY